jgi:hypothetical protein
MNDSIDNDIENLKSKDQNIYNNAFQNLVDRKSDALPHLFNILKDKSSDGRTLAAQAIATIAIPSSADKTIDYLNDNDPLVRAWSAVALRRMRDSRALDALIKTIDDYPDTLHSDQTLSTYALIDWGEEILIHIINLLNSPKFETRRHAFSVVKKIIFNKFKTVEKWEMIWKKNGSYVPDAEEAVRLKCMKKWEKWATDNN